MTIRYVALAVLTLAFVFAGCGGADSPQRSVSCPTREPQGVLDGEDLTRAQVRACQKRFRLSFKKVATMDSDKLCPATLPPGANTTCNATIEAVCAAAVRRHAFREKDDCLYGEPYRPGVRTLLGYPELSLYVPPDWYWIGTDDMIGAEGDLRSPIDDISFYALPLPIYNPRTSRYEQFPRDFAAFLQQHPDLRVDRIRHIRLAGAGAVEIAGTAIRADRAASDDEEGGCGFTHESWGPCVPIAGDLGEDNVVPVKLYPDEHFCFIDLHTPKGRVLIHISPQYPLSVSPPALCDAAASPLKTLRLVR